MVSRFADLRRTSGSMSLYTVHVDSRSHTLLLVVSYRYIILLYSASLETNKAKQKLVNTGDGRGFA
jgi:hypothetical protein